MCGIFLAITQDPDFDFSQIDLELLKKRGPDSFGNLELVLENLKLFFAASVLSLRGGSEHQITSQPLICQQTGNVLLWNGEIYSSDLVPVELNENDSFKLLSELKILDVKKIIESIKGPYAFVFLEKKTNTIYFGRDKLGRRSLLINTIQDQSLILSSVKVELKNFKLDFQEIKSNGVYKINLKNFKNIELLEWKKLNESSETEFTNYLKNFSLTLSNDFLQDSTTLFNQQEAKFDLIEAENDALIEKFYFYLKQSVNRRVKSIPNQCKQCSKLSHVKFNRNNCEHSKIAILFSGGVDSAVLAALVDQCLAPNEQIDLLNIAFEKQVKKEKENKKLDDEEEDLDSSLSVKYQDDGFLVPDRISGLESLKELNPNRKWNFVEINITLDELRKERENLIKHLLYPHQTVLDDSIGCALWFASRGAGFLRQNEKKIEYKSNAEVLILGMGADEQLAGYARHRTRYEKEGVEALLRELKMEMGRISERNLGRDDRILSDHGKESRLPYLDEDVVSFLNGLSISEKCNMKLERGYGEKYLLRSLAQKKFGLSFSSRLKKRAIQFGSRVAKIENIKEKANDKCNRLN